VPADPRTSELAEVVTGSPWFTEVLRVVRDCGLPDAWVGAGALRDLVWGERYGSGFRPEDVNDVDVAFFDPDDLTSERDQVATDLLAGRRPGIRWEATNQAAVHLWYPDLFGTAPVAPLTGVADAVATWPETATAVAVRLDDRDGLLVCAPYGLDDLLDGVWRWNPHRVPLDRARVRLANHERKQRWPGVRIVQPGR
jgi:uncharacterized protein